MVVVVVVRVCVVCYVVGAVYIIVGVVCCAVDVCDIAVDVIYVFVCVVCGLGCVECTRGMCCGLVVWLLSAIIVAVVDHCFAVVGVDGCSGVHVWGCFVIIVVLVLFFLTYVDSLTACGYDALLLRVCVYFMIIVCLCTKWLRA